MNTKEKAPAADEGQRRNCNIDTPKNITKLGPLSIKNLLPDSIVLTAEDLENDKTNKVEFLVDGLIPLRQVTIISGREGSGKTTLLHSLFSAILNGRDFAGRRTKRTNIIVFDAENPRTLLKAMRDKGGLSEGITWIQNPPGFMDVRDRCKLCNSSCKANYYHLLAEFYPDSIFVFDSRRGWEEGAENSDDTKKFNRFLMTIRDKGITVIILHHSGKSKDKDNYFSGHTEIVRGIDNSFAFSAPGRGQKYHELALKKNRFGSPGFKLFLDINFNTLSVEDATTNVKNSLSAKIAMIISELDHSNTVSVTMAANELGVPQAKARKCLSDGLGIFWTTEPSGTGHEKLYELTPEGWDLINTPDKGIITAQMVEVVV